MKKLSLIAMLVFVVGCGSGSPTAPRYKYSLDDPDPEIRLKAIEERKANFGATHK